MQKLKKHFTAKFIEILIAGLNYFNLFNMRFIIFRSHLQSGHAIQFK
jgi:hypothetical protein